MPSILRAFVRDAGFALRTLRRSPAFTIASVLALALAIGANTAVFSVIHSLISLPIPVDDPDRVALVTSENPAQNVTQGGMSVDDFLDLEQTELRSFERLAAISPRQFNVVGAGEPQRVEGVEVTSQFFAVAGIAPQSGRAFGSDSLRKDEVVISHGFWQQSLGGDPDVLGSTVELDGEAHEIIGVMPESFFFLGPNTAVYTPLILERGTAPRDQRALAVSGRMVEGTDSATASVELGTVAARLAGVHPDTNEDWTFVAQTIPENRNQGLQFVVVLLYSSITFVLLIACVNIANLLLARALAREREIALRSSLGASRWQIVRQLLVESLVLAMVGGGAGLGIGLWGIRVLRGWIAPDPNVGFIAQFMEPNLWITLHAFAISAVAGILFGTVPAIQVSRPDLAPALKEGGRGGDSRHRRFLRSALVVSEVALALALLITAGALIRSFAAIYQTDPGFDTENLLTLDLSLPERDYPEAHQRTDFYRQLVDRLAAAPGVEAAAATTVMPLTQFPGGGTAHADLQGEADEGRARDRAPNVNDAVVTPGYFDALGIPLRRGRTFASTDHADGEPVAMITEGFLERFGVDGDGLDLQVRLVLPQEEEPGPWRRVVGVVGDHQSHAHSLRRPLPLPMVYVPIDQAPQRNATVVLRTRVEPTELAQPAREAVWALDPRLPISSVRTLETAVAQIDTQNTFFLKILTGLALTALLLAAVGIYGIITYSVNQRRREIGLRMALGARAGHTMGLVMREAAWLTGTGLVLGTGLALLLVRFMTGQMAAMAQTDAGGPATFAVVSAVFLAVALLSTAVPTLRAMGVDPVEALRDA